MSAPREVLDLRKHDYEDIAGKILQVNGRDYVLLKEVGQGGERVVFVLMNDLSGLTPVVAKVFHALPGSAEYADYLTRLPAMYFKTQASTEDGLDVLIPEALYEMCGGLIAIQFYFGSVENERSHYDLLNRSAQQLKDRQFEAGLATCEELLRLNPFHDQAWANKAAAFMGLDAYSDAISCMHKAIEIEPNVPNYSRELAALYARIGAAKKSMLVSSAALTRWREDGLTWRKMVRTAIQFDAANMIEKELRYGFEALPQLADLKQEVDESRARWTRYESELVAAQKLQEAGAWEAALPILRRAASISVRNELALLNEQLCLARLGRWSSVGHEAATLAWRCTGPVQDTAFLLAFLGFAKSRDPVKGRALALHIAQMFQHPFDLPLMPTYIGPTTMSASREVDDIVATLLALCGGASDDEQLLLRDLAALFQETLTAYPEEARAVVSMLEPPEEQAREA
jgi:tetratricopeptide (TPR) repeat protein